MTMVGDSKEILRATRLTRTVVGAVGLLFVAAVLLRFAEKAIAVPELTKGIFKEETTVTIEMVPAPVKEKIIEHTAEKSDFTIAAKPTPVKPVEAAPAPEVKPVAPEPAVKPKPVPKKAAEARKRVKPVSPIVKPQAPAAVEKTVPAEAQTGAGKGASAVAVNPEKPAIPPRSAPRRLPSLLRSLTNTNAIRGVPAKRVLKVRCFSPSTSTPPAP